MLCGTNVMNAQQATFSKVFSNFPLNPENGWQVAEVSNGYLMISAIECLDDNSEYCSALIHIDKEGNIVWLKTINQSLGYKATLMAILGDKIYISGRSIDFLNRQFSAACFDLNGYLLWQRTYGNLKPEWPAGIVKTQSGNLILYGERDRMLSNQYEWLPVLIKINDQGDSIKVLIFNEQYNATSVIQVVENSERNLIASYVYCPDACFLDLKAGVICLDSLGDTKWTIDFPYSYNPYECVLAQTDSNNLAIKWFVDNTTIPNHDLTPPAIFFADMSGNILDTVVFQNQTLKEIRNMEPVWEKGLVGCGHEYPYLISQNSQQLFGWLFRMDENREVLWERSYIDSTYKGKTSGLRHIIPTSDGGYLATGTITNFMTGVWESHNWLLKLDSFGCLEPGCGNINYITDTKEAVFLKGKDIKIYPNPASDYVQVEFPVDFDIGQNTYAVLTSNTGSIVRQEKINAIKNQLNLTGILSGIYYLMISRGNEIIGSKRIVVHK